MAEALLGAEKEKEVVGEAERLDIKDKAPVILAELLFDVNMVQQIKTYASLLKRVCIPALEYYAYYQFQNGNNIRNKISEIKISELSTDFGFANFFLIKPLTVELMNWDAG